MIITTNYLARVQVAETSDNFLLVEIASSCFHTTNSVQLFVIFESIIPIDCDFRRRSRLQFVESERFCLEGRLRGITILLVGEDGQYLQIARTDSALVNSS